MWIVQSGGDAEWISVLASPQPDGHVRVAGVEIQEVVLDDVALVAERDDELRKAVEGVDLHDVPEDGMLADLQHRLGPQIRSPPRGGFRFRRPV